MDPFTDVTLTPAGPGIPVGTLQANHTGVDLDRIMLGYKDPEDASWTNLTPQPAATYGSGPYSAVVPLHEGRLWRMLAINSDGEVA